MSRQRNPAPSRKLGPNDHRGEHSPHSRQSGPRRDILGDLDLGYQQQVEYTKILVFLIDDEFPSSRVISIEPDVFRRQVASPESDGFGTRLQDKP